MLTTLTPGAVENLTPRPVRELAGVRDLTYLSTQDVAGRKIERHRGSAARVVFYQVDTPRGRRYLMVYVTAENLITDYDVVEK